LKKCSKCNRKKEASRDFFYADASKRDNLSPSCKECRKSYNRVNSDRIREIGRDYRNNNKNVVNMRKRSYRSRNIEKCRESDKVYYRKNKKVIRENAKNRYVINKDAINKKQREYEADKKLKNPMYKFKSKIRKLIGRAISRKGFTKRSSCSTILGCDWELFKRHLETSFEYNYGIGSAYLDWNLVHVDHIIPLNEAVTEADVLKLNHYSNLQLLYAEDNMDKGCKLNWRVND
jgi:hypothetical protein